MNTTKVPGEKDHHRILVYALSTCVWCKRTKQFLKDSGFSFEYIDVDTCSSEDREKVKADVLRREGRLSYPVIIVNDNVLINGFHPDRIMEALTD